MKDGTLAAFFLLSVGYGLLIGYFTGRADARKLQRRVAMSQYIEISRIAGVEWEAPHDEGAALYFAGKLISGAEDVPLVKVEQVGVDPKLGAIYELIDEDGLIVCHAARLIKRDTVRAEIRNVNQFARKA